MLLAIDVGNTQIKLAVFEQNTLINKKIIPYSDWEKEVQNTLFFFSEIKNIAVASVGKLQKSDFLGLKEGVEVSFISYESKFPFQNHYATPKTLGMDRMVLTSGAVLKFPNQNRLVIDAGTCITYDFIDENNNYLGGAISPGIRLRYESLHHFTAKLPLLSLELFEEIFKEVETHQFIGNSTSTSIHSGVLNGVQNEIEGFIAQYQRVYPKFIIILTGGDTEFLANRLKNTIFANSNFLLESLNQTFQYKNQND